MNRVATDLPAHLKLILTPIAEPCFRRYKVVLHCTSDPCRSTDLVGPPVGWHGNARRQLAQRGRAPS
jgi:hypothetical protein